MSYTRCLVAHSYRVQFFCTSMWSKSWRDSGKTCLVSPPPSCLGLKFLKNRLAFCSLIVNTVIIYLHVLYLRVLSEVNYDHILIMADVYIWYILCMPIIIIYSILTYALLRVLCICVFIIQIALL